jgi:hypothetical protein
MIAIRQQLHVGQTVEYLDVRDNRMHAAKVIEFKPDQLMAPMMASTNGFATLPLDRTPR